MPEPKLKTSSTPPEKGVPEGYRRMRVTYSPDGFRGVRDVPEDQAILLVRDARAHYVDPHTPLGEEHDEPATPEPAAAESPESAPAGAGGGAKQPAGAGSATE